MEKILLLLIMMACLFGPMTLFVILGQRAMEGLGKRPSEGSATMIPFLIKVVAASLISVGILMILLKVFGPTDAGDRKIHYRDSDWHLMK